MPGSSRHFKDTVYEQFARVGKAVSSPRRLELLDLLCQGPRTVEVLARALREGSRILVVGDFDADGATASALAMLGLRALGFQREMVSWVFLIESSFVALLGISLGVGLALIPASQVIADMAVDIPGLTFQVPWTEIVFVSGLAYAMTLLTTWLPAVQASQVGPAEALRYE